MDWLTYKKCVPFDFSPYRAGFAAAGVNGLSLFQYAVKRPALLKDELNIKNINARRTLVEAVCREIEGLGCLGPPSSQAGDFFGAQQDDNDDGQVSEEEFKQEQGESGAGEALSYWCMRP